MDFLEKHPNSTLTFYKEQAFEGWIANIRYEPPTTNIKYGLTMAGTTKEEAVVNLSMAIYEWERTNAL